MNPSRTPPRDAFLTANEAASRLGVKPATLYAYVARGFVRSEAGEQGRKRRYVARDIDLLVERKKAQRSPELAAKTALFWGAPVIESSISFIDGTRLYYRGLDAVALAARASFERVATLLWTGSLPEHVDWGAWPIVPDAVTAALHDVAADASPVARLQVAASLLAVRDERRFDTGAAEVVQTATRLVRGLVASLARTPDDRIGGSFAAGLLAALGGRGAVHPAGVAAIDRALVLSAEHELNASTFAARVTASAGSDPYSVVSAALAAIAGPKHGGACDRVEALVREVDAPHEAHRVLTARAARGESPSDLRHPLYRDGDPRLPPLLDLADALRRSRPRGERRRDVRGMGVDTVLAVARALAERSRGAGTLDLGLVAVAHALRLPTGSATAIFAVGRVAGWIAHAIEQYAMDEIIRPRARYVGPTPERP